MSSPRRSSAVRRLTFDDREEEALLHAKRPRPGWISSDGVTWQKDGLTYTVASGLPKRRWNAADPPYLVIDPDGKKMGGSSHLSRAQRLAEVLANPLPARFVPDYPPTFE